MKGIVPSVFQVVTCDIPRDVRYASLYFIAVTDPSDNELITLEIIHHFVEVLDKYFGNVSNLRVSDIS